MPAGDIIIVLRWWGSLFLIGAAGYPLTRRLFEAGGRKGNKALGTWERWYDGGYAFSKAVGLAVVTWIVYVLGILKLSPFTVPTIIGSVIALFAVGLYVQRKPAFTSSRWKREFFVILGEELFFLGALFLWAWVKAHEPSVRGLEKFMDYGFMQSILQSKYFPPADMWFPPNPINYYYFGHLATALITRLSYLDLGYTFNLMLSTIFAWSLTMSFSIGVQLVLLSPMAKSKWPVILTGGAITAFLVTLSGNMQTVYAFTRGYTGDNVKPFWELLWGSGEFIRKVTEGMNTYWYANATRFIPYTIHEFPSYSFVVSDVHGHVLSIPFVLVAIALIITSIDRKERDVLRVSFYGFLVGVLLMTNALDGPIYFALLAAAWGWATVRERKGLQWNTFKPVLIQLAAVLVIAGVTSAPFLLHFKSFVNGLAVNCPLPFFASSKIGPILFETVDKCQRSPLWMMWLLWGFFWFAGIILIMLRVRSREGRLRLEFTQHEALLIVFYVFSILLVIFPEFFYFKDIYPQHFRSNTMFKLGYQAFIMWSILSGYAITQLIFVRDNSSFWRTILRRSLIVLLLPQLFLVSIYPMFSIRSYFGQLKRYEGLYGLTWMMREHFDDYQAIFWLRSGLAPGDQPVVVESDGDSYSPTDENRISVFTGTPTVIGWAVHEWLWRGTYDVVSPRREEVRRIYESDDIEETRAILAKYRARYVVVGTIERTKFVKLNEEKFMKVGEEAFRSGSTVVYEVGR